MLYKCLHQQSSIAVDVYDLIVVHAEVGCRTARLRRLIRLPARRLRYSRTTGAERRGPRTSTERLAAGADADAADVALWAEVDAAAAGRPPDNALPAPKKEGGCFWSVNCFEYNTWSLTGASPGVLTASAASYGTTLKPKNNCPKGKLRGAGTRISVSMVLLVTIRCWLDNASDRESQNKS
jgi:hypothetical protein